MRRSLFFLLFISLLATNINADYLFPSSNPPGGKTADEVNQYMVISWEESGYSGKMYTMYDDSLNPNFANSSWIGGQSNEGGSVLTKPNMFNLFEGDIGLSWASRALAGHKVYRYPEIDTTLYYPVGDTVIYNDSIWYSRVYVAENSSYPTVFDSASYPGWNDLAGWEKNVVLNDYPWTTIGPLDHSLTKKNPDNSPIHFTFNVTAGLFVSTYPTDWKKRESKFGYWTPKAEDYVEGMPADAFMEKGAVSWGREHQILTLQSGGDVFQQNYIQNATLEAISAGHEIANFTLDGLSPNSPLLNNAAGFAKWGGEGYDNTIIDSVPGYMSFNESQYFGHRPGANADMMGWKLFAGQDLSKDGWKGVLGLSSEELNLSLGVEIANNNLFGFMAPNVFHLSECTFKNSYSYYSDNSRNMNSQLFYALKELGYEYDNSIEDGWQSYRDSTNFLWPYTTDNGTPWSTYAKLNGIRVNMDSLPAGVWEIPNNVLIVPPTIRQSVYDKRKQMNDQIANPQVLETYNEWITKGAKISASDISTWIVYGMTADEWLQTMKYNVNHRKNFNKAPMHYRGQTKVYTPMIDYSDLTSDFHRASFGQIIDNNWSSCTTRIQAMDEFVDWATANSVYFVSAHELIQKVKAMQSSETVGTENPASDTTSWISYAIRPDTTQNYRDTTIGDSVTASFFVENDCLAAGVAFNVAPGEYRFLDHISLNYKTNVPLELSLLLNNGDVWKVELNNLNNMVNSGLIPISAFEAKGGVFVNELDRNEIKQVYFNIINVHNKTIVSDITVSSFKTYTTIDILDNISNLNSEQTSKGGDSVVVNLTWNSPLSPNVDTIGILWKMHDNPWDLNTQNQDGSFILNKGVKQLLFKVPNKKSNVYFYAYTRDNDAQEYSSPLYDTLTLSNNAPTDIIFTASKSLKEDDTVNTVVGILKTIDEDIADSSSFIYSIVDTTLTFSIFGADGIIVVNKPLAAGDYYMTVTSKDYYGDSVSKEIKLSVESVGVDTYKFTKVDAADTSSSYHPESDTFNIAAASKPDSANIEYQFEKWIGDNQYLSDSLNANPKVTMPADSIIVIAQYSIFNYKPTDIEFTGTSINGDASVGTLIGTLETIDIDTNDSYIYTIIDSSQYFSVSNDSVVLKKELDSSLYNTSLSFKVQSVDDKNSSVVDSFTVAIIDPTEPTYKLVINYGSESDTTSYNKGAIVNISAPKIDSLLFKEWVGGIEYITTGNKLDSNITITMPEVDVTITATYIQLYYLSVISGNNSGYYQNGEEIQVIADYSDDKEFLNWAGDIGTISDSLNDTVTVIMPDSNITITANYTQLYYLNVKNGTGSGYYKESTSVPVTANDAVFDQRFDKWTGDIGNISDSLATSITVIVPDSNIAITANYIKLYQLTVENGIGSGLYPADTSVQIIANAAPIGNEFDKWVGGIDYLDNSLNDTVVLSMPDTAVYLKAEFKSVEIVSLIDKINSDSSLGADDFILISELWNKSVLGENITKIDELAPYTGTRPYITVIGDSVFNYKDLSSFTSLCYHYAKKRAVGTKRVTASRKAERLQIKTIKKGEGVNVSALIKENMDVAGCLVKVIGLPNSKITESDAFTFADDVLSFRYKEFDSNLAIFSRLSSSDIGYNKNGELFNINIEKLPVPLSNVILEYEIVNSNSEIIEKRTINFKDLLRDIEDEKLELFVVPNPSVISNSNSQFTVLQEILNSNEGFNFYFNGIKDDEILNVQFSIYDHTGLAVVTNDKNLNSNENVIFWNGKLDSGRVAGIGAYIIKLKYSSKYRKEQKVITVGIEANK